MSDALEKLGWTKENPPAYGIARYRCQNGNKVDLIVFQDGGRVGCGRLTMISNEKHTVEPIAMTAPELRAMLTIMKNLEDVNK